MSGSNSPRLREPRISIGKVYLRFGEREQISNAHWVRSSAMKVAVRAVRRGRMSKWAGLCALIAAITGCHRDAQIPTKPSVPVRLVEVTLYASAGGVSYSASRLPFAQ